MCVARKGDKNLCELVGILRHLRRWSVFEALKTVRGLYTKLAVDFFKDAVFLPLKCLLQGRLINTNELSALGPEV